MKRLLSYLPILLLLSCKKEEIPEDTNVYPEFLVFGYTQPCTTFDDLCVEIFKIETGGLYESPGSDQPTGTAPYNTSYDQRLSTTKYRQIETLFKGKIPEELLNMNSGTIGTNNGQNSFYWYFEYKTPQTYKYWRIANDFSGSIPPTIQSFVVILSQAASIASSP